MPSDRIEKRDLHMLGVTGVTEAAMPIEDDDTALGAFDFAQACDSAARGAHRAGVTERSHRFEREHGSYYRFTESGGRGGAAPSAQVPAPTIALSPTRPGSLPWMPPVEVAAANRACTSIATAPTVPCSPDRVSSASAAGHFMLARGQTFS